MTLAFFELPSGCLSAFVVSLWLLGAVAAFGQYRPYPAVYTPKQLLADYSIFEEAMREAHAGLYAFRSKQEIDQVFSQARNRLGDAGTERELHLALSWVIAQVQDGHTFAMLSQAALEYSYRQPMFFPFRLAFIEGRAYLHRDLSEGLGHLVGAQVAEINARPMAAVLEQMLAHTSGDGASISGRYHRLRDEVTFGRIYQLLFGPTASFELRVVPRGKVEGIKIKTPAITRAMIDQRLEERYQHLNDSPYLSLGYPEDVMSTAVMRIGFFTGDSYPEFIDHSFEEIHQKKIRNLVLDLRGNGGGLEIFGQGLVSYLVDKPFAFYENVAVNARRFGAYDYSQNTATVYNEAEATPGPDGRFFLTKTRRSFLAEQQPREPRFAGRLFILIDGGSFSTTADVCTAADLHTGAVFVGEEAGGSYYGNTSGNSMTIYLPHTKSRVQIPLERYNNNTKGYEPKNRGLIPDHTVQQTVADLVEGTDSVLEYTFDLIRKNDAQR